MSTKAFDKNFQQRTNPFNKFTCVRLNKFELVYMCQRSKVYMCKRRSVVREITMIVSYITFYSLSRFTHASYVPLDPLLSRKFDPYPLSTLCNYCCCCISVVFYH